MTTSLIHNI